MLQGGIKIFTVRGIEIRLDYSWFLIFALVTYSLAVQYFPQQHHWSPALYWSLGLVTSILFFLSVLLHELSHSFVAQSRGIPVPRITLFIFGGAAQIAQEPKKAGDELVMALAGPGMSVLIGAVSGALWWLFKRTGIEPLSALFGWLALINVSLAVFNLIPGFPLDGGRVLRAIIWGASKDSSRSTMIAGAVGKGVAFLFIFLGVFLLLFKGEVFNGLWIAFIGWFLLQAASASTRQQALTDLLAGHTAGEVMQTDCPFIESGTLVSDLVYRQILHTGRRCFPVLDDGQVSGIVTIHSIKAVPMEQWAQTTARAIMIPADRLKSVAPETPLSRVMELIAADGVNQAPVVKDGKFIGMVSRDSVMDFLRNKNELGLK